MKIMSYFKWYKMRSQPSTRSVRSRRILHALVCTGTWSRGIGRTKRYYLLFMAKTRLNIPRLVWEATYVTWIGIDFVIHSTPYESICSALIPKRIFDSFLELVCPIFPRRNVGTEVRYVRTFTFGSCGSQALRSMTTGRRLTHQRLATWRIVTFSEIDSRHYAMAYDTRPHEWSYQPWILAEKNLQEEKIRRQEFGVSFGCVDKCYYQQA